MPTISLTLPVAGTTITAGLHAANYTALQSLLNAGLDQLNFASGKIFDPAKLMQDAATDKQFLQWNNGAAIWNPAGDWTGYTPAWTSTGVAPAVGNATVSGRFCQIGKLVVCQGAIAFGGTSTFGTGTYKFSLPVTRGAAGLTTALGIVDLTDTSTGDRGLGVAEATSTTVFQVVVSATYFGVQTAVTNTTPWTWATGDSFAWTLNYEAA